MRLFKRLRYAYANASDRAQHEIKVLLVLLCAALLINIPSLIQNSKVYAEWKKSASQNTEWTVTAPEQQGLDGKILNGSDAIFGKSQVCSFLLVRHGVLVHEKYFNGMGAENYNNVYSVTKSVVSALTGIAIEKGLIGGTGETLDKYFPDFCKTADPGFSKITLDNLLTMTPGFCEDLNSWEQQKDMVNAVFSLPLTARPGEEFQYANSASHLVSAILTKATGMSTYEFARENLFKPLGISSTKWGVDGTGIYTGYANLYLRPRDMAKFGLLYLNGGKWNGQQLVPESWVKTSVERHWKFKATETDQASQEEISDKTVTLAEEDSGYGYKWWVSKIGGYETFSAVGYGGQYITVIPELDMVLVMTSRPDTPVGPGADVRMELLEKYIFPAVKN